MRNLKKINNNIKYLHGLFARKIETFWSKSVTCPYSTQPSKEKNNYKKILITLTNFRVRDKLYLLG